MFQAVAPWLDLLANVATAIGVTFAVKALHQTYTSQQVQLFESVFQKVHAAEADFYKAKQNPAMTNDDLMAWRSIFLNALEYFAFLVNKGFMTVKLASFFTPAVENWYRTIVQRYETPAEKNNLEAFKEIRRLHREIKEGKFNAYT